MAVAAASTVVGTQGARATVNFHYTSVSTQYFGTVGYYDKTAPLFGQSFFTDQWPTVNDSTQGTDGGPTAFADIKQKYDSPLGDGSAYDYNYADAQITATSGALHANVSVISSEPGMNPAYAGPAIDISTSASATDKLFMFGPSSAATLDYTVDFHYHLDSLVGDGAFSAALQFYEGNTLVLDPTATYSTFSAAYRDPFQNDIQIPLQVPNGTFLTTTNTIGVSAAAGNTGYGLPEGESTPYGSFSALDASETSYFTITPVTPGASYTSDSGTVYDGSAVPEPASVSLVAVAGGAMLARRRRRVG